MIVALMERFPVLKFRRLAVTIGLMVVPVLAVAQNIPKDDEHHGPSPESIAACKDKSEGGACEFDGRHGHVSGTCHKTRAGDLACFHPRQHHDGGTQ
jgi:hypothetical protein